MKEKAHSVKRLFFSDEWSHRMGTGSERWAGGSSSTYLNAENSAEKYKDAEKSVEMEGVALSVQLHLQTAVMEALQGERLQSD